MRLPEKGRSLFRLKEELAARGQDDARWRDGRTALYVFNAGPEVAQVQKEAYSLYMAENGLAPLAFPSLRSMEEEVVGFSLDLLHAPTDATGTLTSGGSESIFLALKTLRDHARTEGRIERGDRPVIVAPFSAHPAFDKAAALLDLEIRRVPVAADYRADVAAMADAVDQGTIGLVGSAPCFPFGLIDDIEALGALAERHGLWLHVDACVGGYFAPFAQMNGAGLAPFDFAVPAVKSISADLHKYGYAAKGASCLMLRDEALKAHMIFQFDAWPCGTMITPTMAGTRPGGAIAAAWAVMNFLGIEGYRDKQGQVTEAREKLQQGVTDLGFQVLGDPKLGLMAYGRDDLDIAAVWQALRGRGWITAMTRTPPAIHLMLSPVHATLWQDYLADLEEARDAVLAGEAAAAPEAVRYS